MQASSPSKPSVLVTLTLAWLAAGLLAQDQPVTKPPDPALQALLAKMAAARAPTGKPPTLTMAGSYAVTFDGSPSPVAKGTFREAFDGDTLACHRSDMGPMGAMERGVRGDVVWEIDPAMGAKLRSGPFAAHVRRYCQLLRGVDVRREYQSFERLDTTTVDGVEVTRLRLGAREGKPDIYFVDGDGRVRRVDMLLPPPELADDVATVDDMMLAEITFRDFDPKAGGMPRTRSLRMHKASVTFTCDQLEIGQPIDPKTFLPPQAVQELTPAPNTPLVGADGKPIYSEVVREVQLVASIRVRCKTADISAELAILLPEVMEHLNATGAKVAGAPFSRYHAFGADEVDLEAGIPVQQRIDEKGRVKNSQLPAGKTISCWHIGPYDKLSVAHEGLQQRLVATQRKARGGPWEVYWTDPGMVPDASKWKTQLFAPVE